MDDLTEAGRGRRRRALHPPSRRVRARPDAGASDLPDDLVARLEGKSSLGRLGLLIHSTAGFVDPCLEGNLTLELSNVANLPITIYYGMPIGQISFMRMDGPVEQPYGAADVGSKYQGQAEPTPSRFYRNFDRTGALVAWDRRYHSVLLEKVADAQHRTARDRHHPDHRPDRLRAEAAARARPVDGQGNPRVQGLPHQRQGRRRRGRELERTR